MLIAAQAVAKKMNLVGLSVPLLKVAYHLKLSLPARQEGSVRFYQGFCTATGFFNLASTRSYKTMRSINKKKKEIARV